jgi:four helix bundle protein
MRPLDPERLEVYPASLAFIGWLEPLPRRLPKGLVVFDQGDRASTSIPRNLAEGNGAFTQPDRCRDLDRARGSALESGDALEVSVARGRGDEQDIQPGKERPWGIVSMLVGLTRSNSDDRLREGTGDFDWD